MSVQRVKVVNNGELLEGPHWDPATQSLYFVDIYAKNFFKYTPATEQCVTAHIDEGWPSIIIPIAGEANKFVTTVNTAVATIVWDGSASKLTPKIIADVGPTEPPGCRINDAKCDPFGRLWFGTMGPEPVALELEQRNGAFYNLQKDGSIQSHFDGVGISNGLAWNEDRTKFYYNDSFRFTVDQFDYDAETATISNRTPIFTLAQHGIEAYLDGMTIDTDGNLWTAAFNSSSVIKIDPRRPETLLQKIEIPAKQVTSVAWGGRNLDELYVTSANIPINGVVNPGIHNGGLFRVTGLNARGCPATNAKI